MAKKQSVSTKPRMQSLENTLLIATPTLDESPFERTVTYLCEHNDQGALGIVINQPSEVAVSHLLRDLELTQAISPATRRTPVLMGGPVAIERGFVIFRNASVTQSKSNIHVGDVLTVSGSKDTLARVAKAQRIKHKNMLVSLGCASWEPGQLESELVRNCWVLAPADPEIIFDLPFEARWRAAGDLIGIDFNRMVGQVGNS